jgi:hypothetical protein
MATTPVTKLTPRVLLRAHCGPSGADPGTTTLGVAVPPPGAGGTLASASIMSVSVSPQVSKLHPVVRNEVIPFRFSGSGDYLLQNG